MKKVIRNFIVGCVCAALIGCVLFLLAMQSGIPNDNVQSINAENQHQAKQGYRAAIYNIEDDTFLVAGTGGRLDRINNEKVVQKIDVPTTEDLLSFGFDENAALIAGTGGTILYTEDGEKFSKADTGITSTIFGITSFKGKYYACGQQGVLLSSYDGKAWKRKSFADKKDIISIAATNDYLMAVMQDSDFYISPDGVNWFFQNFNEAYSGYYEPYLFKGVRAINNSFYVFGQLVEDPDLPFLMRTDDGKTWLPTPLSTIDIGDDEKVVARINEISPDLDQFVAVCDEGRVMTITDCITCHKLSKYIDVDLYGIAFGREKLLIAGDNFEFDLLDPEATRQYNIKAEQAYEDFKNGAVIVDVRTDEEYNQGHIKGCIHIPVEQIEEKLPELIPNLGTEIIFYCAKGTRAQTALEVALTLGYERVYNLGGLSDWPYETE